MTHEEELEHYRVGARKWRDQCIESVKLNVELADEIVALKQRIARLESYGALDTIEELEDGGV